MKGSIAGRTAKHHVIVTWEVLQAFLRKRQCLRLVCLMCGEQSEKSIDVVSSLYHVWLATYNNFNESQVNMCNMGKDDPCVPCN